jgi:hypothetical protein
MNPRPANWRDATCTCTRCGEVRGAFSGRTLLPALDEPQEALF